MTCPGADDLRERNCRLHRANGNLHQRAVRAEKRVQALETALMMIRDREWVENALDPQWPAQVARDALKDD